MRIGALFSGGKDSTYAAYLASREHELVCLITLESENKSSFMFHTPSISQVKKQAEVMNIPLLVSKTKGEKELELQDLEEAIKAAIKKYKIAGIVTGALASNYQASRIQNICDKLDIKCINPLWQKNQLTLLSELLENNFKAIIIGVFAYPLDSSWLGREINPDFISQVSKLAAKFKINPAGEGGEFESFVLNCPLFSRELKIKEKKVIGEKNSWALEIKVA